MTYPVLAPDTEYIEYISFKFLSNLGSGTFGFLSLILNWEYITLFIIEWTWITSIYLNSFDKRNELISN